MCADDPRYALLEELRASCTDQAQLRLAEGTQRAASVVWLPRRPASGVGGAYDRAGALQCRAARLRRGGALTVVAFSEARWRDELERFPQHTMIFLYIRTAEDSSGMEDVHATHGYGKWRLDEGRVERLGAYYPPENAAPELEDSGNCVA